MWGVECISEESKILLRRGIGPRAFFTHESIETERGEEEINWVKRGKKGNRGLRP